MFDTIRWLRWLAGVMIAASLGAAGIPAPVTAQSVTATPVRGSELVVRPGGTPLVLSLSGNNLARLDSASVARGGARASGVTATLIQGGGRLGSGDVRASVSAAPAATPADDYQLLVWRGHAPTTVTSFRVLPPPPVPTGVLLSPGSVVGGEAVSGTVTLDRVAPAGGLRVALSSSDGSAAAPPSAVTVAAGQTSASFPVPTRIVAAERSVTVQATASGESRSAPLRVLPPPPPVPAGIGLSGDRVVGGSSVTGTVTLDRPAPTGGTPVALSVSDAAAASVPASVSVAAGQTGARFQVSTQRVDQERTVTVRVTASGQSRSAAIQVVPYVPVVSAVTLSKASVTGGESVSATVRLASPPPPGGVSIPLKLALEGATSRAISGDLTTTTSRTAPTSPLSPTTTVTSPSRTTTLSRSTAGSVSVPGSVTVLAGRTDASVEVRTEPATSDQRVTLTAGSAPDDASATLTVVTPHEALFVGLRLEGPDHVDEGGTAAYRAIAEFDNGSTSDVTDHVFGWRVDSGVGATIQSGVLSAPSQVSQASPVLVTAAWGMPDEALKTGSKTVTIRTWTVEVEGPDEVRESDVDSHLQSGAVQYRAVVVRTDGARIPVTASSWGLPGKPSSLGANILPDGTFGVFSAGADAPVRISARATHEGSARYGEKEILVRRLAEKLEGLRIVEAPYDVVPGTSVQLRAQAELRGASDPMVNPRWALVSGPAGTSIDATTGLFTAGSSPGRAEVTATYEKDGITKVAVWKPEIRSTTATRPQQIEILPPAPNSQWPPTMWSDESRQYQAQAGFVDGRKEPIQPEWSVSGTAADISDTGLFQPRDIDADAPVTITARYVVDGQVYTATQEVTVKALYPSSCELETGRYASVRISPGGSVQLRLRVRFSSGEEELLTEGVAWEISDARWIGLDLTDPIFSSPPDVSISAAGLVQAPEFPADETYLTATVRSAFAAGGRECRTNNTLYSQ